MAQFRVKYASGKVQEENVHGCDTVEEYANRKFGRGVDYEEFGTTVEIVGVEDDRSEADTEDQGTADGDSSVEHDGSEGTGGVHEGVRQVCGSAGSTGHPGEVDG